MNTHVPLRSILLATNLSDIDWLLPLACSLAQESGASITVLHVLAAIRGFTLDTGCTPYYDPREATAATEKELQAICARTCPVNVHCDVLVLDGAPADGILASARQLHADMLILGTRGYCGVEKWLLGSLAETVLRSSSIPVVIVGPHARRAAASGRPIHSILLGASLSGRSSSAVNIAFQWTERLHAHLTLLHVLPDGSQERPAQQSKFNSCEDKMRSLLPAEAFQKGLVETQIRTGRPSREILAAAAHADVIALGAQHHPLLGRLAPEGTLHRVLAEARCPVATFHHDQAKARHA